MEGERGGYREGERRLNRTFTVYFEKNYCLRSLPAKCKRIQILVIIEVNSVVSGVVTCKSKIPVLGRVFR